MSVDQETGEVIEEKFKPGKHLMQLQGRDYLEVKWRLLWLRTEHPDASISTQLITDGDNRAVFKAMVSLPSGASAIGHGSETYQDFGDYLEKAETKAIGRALSALGYGTQFCDDHDFGSSQGRVVDSPVARQPQRTIIQGQATPNTVDFRQRTTGAPTDKQIKWLKGMVMGELNDWQQVDQYIGGINLVTVEEFRQAIEVLKARKEAGLDGDGTLEEFTVISGRKKMAATQNADPGDELPF